MENIKLQRALDQLIVFKNSSSSDIIEANKALNTVKSLTCDVELKLEEIFEKILKDYPMAEDGEVVFQGNEEELIVKHDKIYDIASPELLDFLEIHCPGMVNREPTVHPRAFQEFMSKLDEDNVNMLIKKGCLKVEKSKYLEIKED